MATAKFRVRRERPGAKMVEIWIVGREYFYWKRKWNEDACGRGRGDDL